jgi:hypothetical protein
MQMTTFVKEQNERVKESIHLATRQENIKTRGGNILCTMENQDLLLNGQGFPFGRFNPSYLYQGESFHTRQRDLWGSGKLVSKKKNPIQPPPPQVIESWPSTPQVHKLKSSFII